MINSWESLLSKTLEDAKSKAAFDEVNIRSYIGRAVSAELARKNISQDDFAEMLNIPKIHVKRLIGEDIGGSLPLLSIVKALNVLDLELELVVRYKFSV